MRALLLIPSVLKPECRPSSSDAPRPTMDYHALARELRTAFAADVELVGYAELDRVQDTRVRALRRTAGPDAALALLGFLLRDEYDAVFTNGENVGLPLAALLRARGGRHPGHVTIGHRLSTRKKRFFFRNLALHRQMDTIFVYASTQEAFGRDILRVPDERLTRIAFHADTDFWRPLPDVPEQDGWICAAGLEWRDYPTLIEAVRPTPALTVRLAAASPWSKHRNETEDRRLPENVDAHSYDYAGLRELYARSQIVAVPLYENDFQAGVTSLLEAMAMGKAVICTQTTGQTDVIVDGENGLLVPPGDVDAWRVAISRLRGDPLLRRTLGEHARSWVQEHATLDRWTARIAAAIAASASPARTAPEQKHRFTQRWKESPFS